MYEPSSTVLPVYFVADESASMANNIGELNDGLLTLLDSLQRQPFAAAKVRFSIIGFSHDAFQYLAPTDLRSIQQLPLLTARGGTSYSAAFECLYYVLQQDMQFFKANRYLVNRPAVFFLSDGIPQDHPQWLRYRNDVFSLPYAPNILAFGVGDADPNIIMQVASRPGFAFQTEQGIDTGLAVTEFINTLTQSVISSGQALAGGEAKLNFEKPVGFISLDVDTF